MGRMKVGALGALNVDIIIHGSAPSNLEELRNWVGYSEITCLTAGSVGYFSQNLAKLGCEVHLVSAIGNDPFGEFILASLRDARIRTDHIIVEKDTKSGIGVYMLLFGASKRPMTYQLPTHNGWPPHLTQYTTRYLLDTDAIHCGGYLHFSNLWNGEVERLFSRAQENGLITSLDPQFPLSSLESPWLRVLKPTLAHTDILFVDENEALGVSGANNVEEATKTLAEIGVRRVVIKLGQEGCLVLDEGKTIHRPAIKPSRFVDSIGAGDSFDAGFLYATLKGYGSQKAAELATYVASKSIEGVGTTTFPTKEDLP